MDDIFNNDLKKLKEQQLPEQEMTMPEEGEISSKEIPVPDYREDLLNRYRQLNQRKNDLNSQDLESLQESQLEGIRNAGLLQAGSQIAQAMASGYGAKIGDNKAGVDLIKDISSQPIKDYLQKQDAYKKELGITTEDLDLQDDIEMTDPESDISKFYREQAYSLLRKLSPKSELLPTETSPGKLEGMSAEQISKLPGMKNLIGSDGVQKAVGFGQFINAKNNHPLHFDQATNTMMDSVTKQPVDESVVISRPIGYTDPVTGGRGYLTSSGMSMPGISKLDNTKIKDEKNNSKEYKYADIAKAAPKQIEVFDKIKKEFNDDMKKSREVATSITNLTSKLKPGKDNVVDSGLLGSVQTQAAKMAGQVGVLTDADLVKFGGAGGWVAAAKRAVKSALLGDISDSDIEFFKTFSQRMGKSLNQDIENRSQLFVDQARQQLETVAPGITNENVAKLLGVSKVAPQVQSKESKVPSDKVRIKTPNGTIMLLPKDKLQEALKKGAVEVK